MYLKRTNKFGLELPKTVNEVYAIDEKNGNTLWQDAIQKEMEIMKTTFHIIPKDEKPPDWFQYVNCHMVFDITNTPDTITYSGVVTR